MTVIIFLMASAIIITALYKRTRRPKGYAFLNSALGAAAVYGYISVFCGRLPSIYESVCSVVLGVPGAALCVILEEFLK